jgi:hypothetical protein
MAESASFKEISEKIEEIKQLYLKVITEPNNSSLKHGFIKCPECGEEILMVPTLRKMNEAIENHVQIHKEQLKTTPLIEHHTAMHIRLDLAQQVLQLASSPQLL